MEEQNNLSSTFTTEANAVPASAPVTPNTSSYQEPSVENKTPFGIIAFIAVLMFCFGCATMYLLITFSVIEPQMYGKKDTKTSTSTTDISEKESNPSKAEILEKEVEKPKENPTSTTVKSNLITKAVNSCKFSFNYEEGAFMNFRDGNVSHFFDDATVSQGMVLSGAENSGNVTKLVSVSCSKTSNTENTYENRRKVLDSLGKLRTGTDAKAEVKEIAKERKIGSYTYLVVDYSYVSPMSGDRTSERLYTIVTPSYQYVIEVLPVSNSDVILEQAGLKFFN